MHELWYMMKVTLKRMVLLAVLLAVCGLGTLVGYHALTGQDTSLESILGLPDSIWQPVQQLIHPEEPLPEGSWFQVYFLDVGEADAALIQCDGQNMMIDGGNAADSSFIYSFLQSHGVNHLDVVVATHGHEDHVGGLAGALKYATADKVYCSVTDYDSKAFRSFVKYAGERNATVTVPKVGDTFQVGSAKVTVLGPVTESDNHNNMSLVLRVTYGDTSFLFTGDAEQQEERDILDGKHKVQSTVLKVSHHGSGNATTADWLQAVKPTYGVISVGENEYGHPMDSVLERLEKANVALYRTDLQGTVLCESDGTKVWFTTERTPAGTEPGQPLCGLPKKGA